jgi:hypothetical protein
MPTTHRRTTTRTLTRRGRYTACASAAVLTLGVAAAAVVWQAPAGTAHTPRTRTDAVYCGLVACSVLHSDGTVTALPARSVPAAGPSSGRAHGRSRASSAPMPSASSSAPVAGPAPVQSPTPAPAQPPTPTPTPVPGPTPTPTPSPTPSPTPTPAGADVTVSYSTLWQWDGGFKGELDIVNQGDSAVNGWQLVITLPGDQVQSVWNANWQQDDWDSVIMTPVPSDQVIEPGTSVSVVFVAQGDPAEPTDCTFNGSPCD